MKAAGAMRSTPINKLSRPIEREAHRASDRCPRPLTDHRCPVGHPAVVLSSMPNGMSLVETAGGDHVLVHASGSVRVGIVRLLAGARVRIERSAVDATKGRITRLESVFSDRLRRAPCDRVFNPVDTVENDQ